jgi:hypothetical protein
MLFGLALIKFHSLFCVVRVKVRVRVGDEDKVRGWGGGLGLGLLYYQRLQPNQVYLRGLSFFLSVSCSLLMQHCLFYFSAFVCL